MIEEYRFRRTFGLNNLKGIRMKAKQLASWMKWARVTWTLGVFACAQAALAAPTQWTALYNRGQPLATYVVGDVLDDQFEFAINTDTTGWVVEYGVGQNADGSDWTWYPADWSRMDGSDNRVWISRPSEHRFTSAGTWYCAGRFVNGGDTYYAAMDWTANSGEPLAAATYFTINELEAPSSVSAIHSDGRVDLGWTRSDDKDVMILMTLVDDFPEGIPEQGKKYLCYEFIGNQLVVPADDGFGVQHGTNLDVTSMIWTGQKTYHFTFYSVNNSNYYSEGVTAPALILAPQARNTGGGAPEAPAEIFLGDAGLTFGFDSSGTFGGQESRSFMWSRPADESSEGFLTGWSDFADAEHKTHSSGVFSSTGTWHWGVGIQFGSEYADEFGFSSDSAEWIDLDRMAFNSGSLTVTVQPIEDPVIIVAEPMYGWEGTNRAVILDWSGNNRGDGVMIVRKRAEDAWTEPAQGQFYDFGANIGAGTVIQPAGYSSPFVDQVGLEPGVSYDYKIYSVNLSSMDGWGLWPEAGAYYSPGVTAQVSTLPVIEITTDPSPLPVGKEGISYSVVLEATNGAPPYTWEVLQSLPNGLTCSEDGMLTGVPWQAGTYDMWVVVHDGNGTMAEETMQIVVESNPIAITTISLPSGTVGTPYYATLEATNGIGLLTWQAFGLPDGLSCSVDGVLSGTPSSAGTTSAGFEASDTFGRRGNMALDIVIEDASAALMLSQTNVNVREGGEGRFFVRLDRAPTGDVVGAVSRSEGDEGIAPSAGTNLVFKPSNWSWWQAVTLAAPDDANAVGETAVFRVSLAGADDQFVTATVLDDDIAENLALASSGATISATRGYRLADAIDGQHAASTNYAFTTWASVPPGAITLDLQTAMTVSRVRILTWDWNCRDHRYTIESSVDGASWSMLADASAGAHRGWEDWAVANEPIRYLRFRGLENSVNSAVCLPEWEVYGARPLPELIQLSKTNVNVREGGEGRFFVRLASEPAANVVVSVARVSGDESLEIAGGASLTFKPSNWSIWQKVTLAQADDADADGETATLEVSMPGVQPRILSVVALDDDVGDNLALASAGTTMTGRRAYFMPYVIDGAHTVLNQYGYTIWTNVPPGTMTLDLRQATTVSRVRVLNWDWTCRFHRYVVEGSADGSSWTTLADASGADRQGWDDWAVADETVRYVRFTGLTNSANTAVCISELEVIGTRAATRRSLASQNVVAAGSEPVAVLTSDGPTDETGWNAVDGDEETAWVGQKAGGGYLVVEYRPTLTLSGLEVDVAETSLADAQVLTSLDGQEWQPLPDDLEANPVVLNFLWIVFPDDGTAAVPEVIEIRPNP